MSHHKSHEQSVYACGYCNRAKCDYHSQQEHILKHFHIEWKDLKWEPCPPGSSWCSRHTFCDVYEILTDEDKRKLLIGIPESIPDIIDKIRNIQREKYA